ncbi:MAG: hypothetical protein QM740_02095 [Acidovorax sp.]
MMIESFEMADANDTLRLYAPIPLNWNPLQSPQYGKVAVFKHRGEAIRARLG